MNKRINKKLIVVLIATFVIVISAISLSDQVMAEYDRIITFMYYEMKSVVLDQELTINASKNLEGDKLSMWGTTNKSNYIVRGTIHVYDIDHLRLVHALTIRSDNDGIYDHIIDISKWEKGSYTIFVSSGEEQKQIEITK